MVSILSRLLILETGLHVLSINGKSAEKKMICHMKLHLNYVKWDQLSLQSYDAKLFLPFWHVIFQ